MIYDCHTHSSISADSAAPMADMAAAAQAKGIGITFTEHVDFGFPFSDPENPAPNADIDAYCAAYDQTCAAYGNMPILLGIEIGFEYGHEAENERYVKKLSPDLVVNSVHSLGGMTLYCEEIYPPGKQHAVYARYLEKVYDSVRLCRDYDVLGHIGFVAKRAQYPDAKLRYDEFPDQLDAILRALIESGHALEVNTSGFRTLDDALPEQTVLRRYRELGGELLTIGSDAHNTDYVGFHFNDMLERIRACGFSYLTHYEKRKAVMLPL